MIYSRLKVAITFTLIFCSFLQTFSFPESINEDIDPLQEGYFLVVGAFKIKQNAIRYSSFINSDKAQSSKIGLNPEKNLFYVYVAFSEDLELIKEKWISYRENESFSDAWVYKNITIEESSDDFQDIEDEEIFEDPADQITQQPIPEPEMDIPEITPSESGVGTHRYMFKVVNSQTLREVPGFVTVVDATRNKVMKSVETNTVLDIPEPTTTTKNIILICDIFGFKKQQVSVKIDEPLASGEPNVSKESDVTVVNFELTRHRKGDVLTMYHVYFYNDAAIMKPESKFELNSLLSMLKENENLEIRIHGHTNGNAPGKIIKLKEDDNNLFEVTANNIEDYGSAKELSWERSAIIAKYLINEGIDGKRMQMKGWGGKKMLHDKKDAQAKRNVRVEIEILKD